MVPDIKAGAIAMDWPTKQPEYLVWRSMKQRCYNPAFTDYKNYGGRGIEVCRRWRDSYADFIADMGRRPSKKHSLDRIDNDGDYEPGNCRWATRSEQNNNSRNNRVVVYQEQAMSLVQALRLAGNRVAPQAAGKRLNRGWSIKDAVERPPDRRIQRRYQQQRGSHV